MERWLAWGDASLISHEPRDMLTRTAPTISLAPRPIRKENLS